ncbi:hypothetical protein D6745_05220 [Candidatus Woesearchaeota archaeon]|nr:MAG: hypothetical protein D6745_05220 [Candidatus Woesearchaeota archaeon]
MRYWNCCHRKTAQSRIFVFVISAVILLLIIAFGNYAIKSFESRKEQANVIVAKTELDSKLSQIKNYIGRSTTITVNIEPYKEVCFVDYEKSSFPPVKISSTLAKSLIEEEERTSRKDNALLISDEGVEFFHIDGISLNKKVACLKAENGIVSIKAEGRGSSVMIGGSI